MRSEPLGKKGNLGIGSNWKNRRNQGRAFWGGNSTCKGRVSGKEVKYLWKSEGTALSIECDLTLGPIYGRGSIYGTLGKSGRGI